jgi:hypothetical protein
MFTCLLDEAPYTGLADDMNRFFIRWCARPRLAHEQSIWVHIYILRRDDLATVLNFSALSGSFWKVSIIGGHMYLFGRTCLSHGYLFLFQRASLHDTSRTPNCLMSPLIILCLPSFTYFIHWCLFTIFHVFHTLVKGWGHYLILM